MAMLRANAAVWAIAAVVLVGIVGAVAWLATSGAIDAGGLDRGAPGGGPRGVNAKIVGLDAAIESPPAGQGLAPVQPVELSPTASTAVSSSSGGLHSSSGGSTAAAVVSAPCATSLVQTILGLGVSLLGGRPGC